MKRIVLFALASSTVLAGALATSSCRMRQSGSVGASTSGQTPVQRLTTEELIRFMGSKVAEVQAKQAPDTGLDPSQDIWDYYADPQVIAKLTGYSDPNSPNYPKDHRIYFGQGNKDLNPLACHPRNVEKFGTRDFCVSYDNLMRFDYANNKVLTDPKDWFVHVIPQYYGGDQPEMLKYIKEGDVIVYFKPHDRGGLMSMQQWRSSHAATIIERDVPGALNNTQLSTVDTPAGYAKPFNGMDATPFHVFRFVPRQLEGRWNLLDEQRKQIARWGSLAFGKFEFSGDYNSMARAISTPDLITSRFMPQYLQAANLQGRTSSLPAMYCSWFTFTNLSLAWMHPMSPVGLGAQYASLQGQRFSGLSPNHSFANGDFDTGYAISAANQAEFDAARVDMERAGSPFRGTTKDFPIPLMTSTDLLHAFLERTVMPDIEAARFNPQQYAPPGTIPDSQAQKMALEFFAGVLKTKAAILVQMSQDRGLASTFSASALQVEPSNRVPLDERRAATYNARLVDTIRRMGERYADHAQKVAAGQRTPLQVVADINQDLEALKSKDRDQFGRVSRRWMPPYGFMRHAEKFDVLTDEDRFDARPQLMYVGTVVHEKYLRAKGQPLGGKKMNPIADVAMDPSDAALDSQIYQMLGCPDQNDGNGWKLMLEAVTAPAGSGPACASAAPIGTRMNDAERLAVLTMVQDWVDVDMLTQRDIYVRNTFGLSPSVMRRLLVSWWNDPTEVFKPAIYQGDGSTIQTAVINIRILVQSPLGVGLNPQQADTAKYNTEGHPRRQSGVPCIAMVAPSSGTTCSGFAQAFDTQPPTAINNPRALSAGQVVTPVAPVAPPVAPPAAPATNGSGAVPPVAPAP